MRSIPKDTHLMSSSLFITCATGYVGKRLVASLGPRFGRQVCLVRRPQSVADDAAFAADHIELLPGDLTDPETYRHMLASGDVVVHLAAANGQLRPSEYHRINADGTRALVEASQAAGVSGFLLVSTIAVKFPFQFRYFYAHSKKKAEEKSEIEDLSIQWGVGEAK